MNRFLICGLIAISGFGIATADTLTPNEALARLLNSGMHRMPSAIKSSPSLTYQSSVGNLYVFTSDKGYAILPNDDRVPALLAYSDSDNFSLNENPELKYWLEYYNSQIEYVQATGIETKDVSGSWRTQREEIKPLLSTKWNQEWPYNILCPKVDNHETVTGCVATAMAQVMKYHNYPSKGKGSYSYYWEPGKEELTFDYENTPFQWEQMTDTYDSKSTEESKHAVAELMLGCGISVNMHYEPGGSGAATTRMGEALIDIFDYSPSLWMPNRTFYGYDEWEGMIYADLAEGLPVLYSGAGTDGGHQFICDGYSSGGYFHFNWGWGGLSNGYFLLTALNPDDLGVGGGAGGFNTSQIATLGVRPAKAGDKPTYIMYNTEGFTSGVKEVKAGEDFRCNGLYYNYSLATLPEGSRLGMKFVADDSKTIKYVDGPGVEGLHLYDGRRDDQIKFPELADGIYTITPALYVDSKWSDIRMPVGYPATITATVKDNIATIQDESEAKIVIRDIDIPSAVYRNHEFPMPFTVENKGDLEFYSTVTPYLLDSEGKDIAKSKFRPLDIIAGESERINDYAANFTAITGKELQAGNYKLVFRDEAGKEVSERIDISIEINDDKTEIEIKGLTLDNKEPIADPSAVKFTFKITCISGVYYGSPRVAIFPGDGGYELYNKASESVYLTPGEDKYVSVITDLSELKDGHYQAAVYNGGVIMAEGLHFTIDRQQTGLTDPTADVLSGEETVYRLNGVIQKGSLTPGLYIIDGKVVLTQ